MNRPSYMPLLFLLSLLGASSAFCADITLNLKLSDNAWKRSTSTAERFSEAEMRSVVSKGLREMQECLNTAFLNAGAPDLKINLIFGSVSFLTPKEEQGISKDLDSLEPNKDKEGKPLVLPRGSETEEHSIVVSDKVPVTHVAFVYSKELSDFRNSQEFQTILRLMKEFSALQRQISENQGRENCQNEKVKLQSVSAELQNYSGRLSKLLIKSNAIYMEANKFTYHLFNNGTIPEENTTFRTLAHELMHSWGGLDDRYMERDLGDNLMKNFKCVLDKSQIDSIRVNRAAGKGIQHQK